MTSLGNLLQHLTTLMVKNFSIPYERWQQKPNPVFWAEKRVDLLNNPLRYVACSGDTEENVLSF